MTSKVLILIGVIGILIACQQKPAVEHGISQSVYMDKLDRSLEARIFQNDETLMNPDSLPADWAQQVRWARHSPDSWFYKYYYQNDTVISEDEMAYIFKAMFENDSVIDMEVRGWDKLRYILPRYDISFYNKSNEKALLKLNNGIVLNFNHRQFPQEESMKVTIYKLPNSILWIELPHQSRPSFRYNGWIIVAIQIKGNSIRPLFTYLIET